MRLTETKDGVFIDIFVKPKSSKFQVTVEGDEIIVRSTEEPERGKVNKEIIKEFTKLFQKKTEIISGLTSRNKKLFVHEVSKDKIAEILSSK